MTRDLAIQTILKRYYKLQEKTTNKSFNYMNYKVINEHDDIFTKIAGVSFIMASSFLLKINRDIQILSFNFMPCDNTKLISNYWDEASDNLADLENSDKFGIICDVWLLSLNNMNNSILNESIFSIIVNPFNNTFIM